MGALAIVLFLAAGEHCPHLNWREQTWGKRRASVAVVAVAVVVVVVVRFRLPIAVSSGTERYGWANWSCDCEL
jgi:multisubunit Na+/H+ antiporter MnhB subunit